MISHSALNVISFTLLPLQKTFNFDCWAALLLDKELLSATQAYKVTVYWPLHKSSISIKSVVKASTDYLQLLSARMGVLDGNSLVHVTLRTFVAAFHAFIVQPMLFTYIRLYFLLASLKPLRWLEDRFVKSMQGENVNFFLIFETF